jgi:ABC-2 type transport system permease protein
MTIFTASAASSLGMLLASICRSRAQLAGISTVVILVMSALGGSMMPRFIMPVFVQEMGKVTFNSWAVEGYLEVFWYSPSDISLESLLKNMLMPLAVLLGMTVVFMCLSRLFVRRWETN